MSRRTPVVTLLPLDDRPVNTGHVAGLAGIAGTRLRLPPAELLPPRGAPADMDGTARWLERSAADSDAVVVSVNQLAYGGFVASRRTAEPLARTLARLDVLRRIRAERPALDVHAFVTLMRTKRFDGAGAEPEYWDRYGRRFFTLSGETYRAEHGRPSAAERARAAIPAPYVADFFTRRMRLHAMQLACVELVMEGVVDTLSILVEDSTVESVSTSEREWLENWIDRLGVGDRVRCFPGADEGAAVLTTRAALEHAGLRPRVAVVCLDPDALRRIAPYEDVPVGDTVAGQAAAVGAELVDDPGRADLVLAVHPPGVPPRDWCAWPDVPERAGDDAARLAARLRDQVDSGRLVAVADVADANGADPALVMALRDAGLLRRLAGYAGWNTAGNTIGSALAQGCSRLLAVDDRQLVEHARTVTHRLVDDWGYQTSARREVLAAETADGGDRIDRVTRELEDRLAELGPPADDFRIVPGSVCFPWDRPFEISFELGHLEERNDRL
ncbi:DUF4127 family protein [Microtetraspora fusca]|uniref:DUF4127 family protein n=1 Tax=Microtetraspora fusca TaxID=1997 RepID=UPI000A00979F|nr:DUF4127 family protein [Microtetraspora fusca]